MPAQTGRRFEGVVHGFELNPRAARVAADRAATMSLSDRYQVNHLRRCWASSTDVEPRLFST